MSNSFIQVCESISLSSVISKYVELHHKGNGEYLGLCPFHSENTPSFRVNDNKQFYYCFGCGAHGNVINFVANYFKLTNYEALERLADEAGIDISHNKQKYQKDTVDKDKISLYYEIISKLAKYYHTHLYNDNSDSRNALSYLKSDRNLNDDVIRKYMIGFAPRDHKIVINLLKQGYNQEDIVKSGALCLSKSNHNKLYNPFSGRIVFPIHNRRGNIIAFGGRILDNDPQHTNSAKYINSSDTELFYKSRNLYGLFHGLTHIRNQRSASINQEPRYTRNKDRHSQNIDNIIMVEGYMDVITLAMLGVNSAVAPLGTAIRIEQIQAIWQYGQNPVICMDNDPAGRKAMLRVAKLLLPYISHNKTAYFSTITKEKDPADFANRYGVEAFNHEIQNNKMQLADFIFNEIKRTSHPDKNSPEEKSAFFNQLTTLANSIKDTNLAKEYNNHFYTLYRQYFKFKKTTPYNSKNHAYSDEQVQKQKSTLNTSYKNNDQLTQDDVLLLFKIFIQNPTFLNNTEIITLFAQMHIEEEVLVNLKEILLYHTMQSNHQYNETTDISTLIKDDCLVLGHDLKQITTFCEKLIAKQYKVGGINIELYSEDDQRHILTKIFNKYKHEKKKKSIKALKKEISDLANKQDNNQTLDKIYEEFVELKKCK